MSRFLDQIRKAKEARERAARKAKLSRKQPPGKEEDSLVPEKKPKHRPSMPAKPSDHLFPSALEKKQCEEEDEKAHWQDQESGDQELYPDHLEKGVPTTASTQDTQPLDRPEDLMPSEMAELPLPKEKPPAPPEPDLVPTEMADGPAPKEKPPLPKEPELVPTEMADGLAPKEKPFLPKEPDLVPTEMADGPAPKEKLPEVPEEELVPVVMAEGPPPKAKLPELPEPDLVPREMADPKAPKKPDPILPREELVPAVMAEGPPPKVKLPEVSKPDLVPAEMADGPAPRKKLPEAPEEELVPAEMADGLPPKVKPSKVPEPDLVPREMAEAKPPKEPEPAAPQEDLVPTEMAEPKPPKKPEPAAPEEDLVPTEMADIRPTPPPPPSEKEEDLIPREMAAGAPPKDEEIVSPEPDLMPQSIIKPPDIKSPEEDSLSELVPEEVSDVPFQRERDEKEAALKAAPKGDLVPEEDEEGKQKRKKILADALAVRNQKLAEERDEEITAQYEKEMIPNSSEVEESAEFSPPRVPEAETFDKPLVPEESEASLIQEEDKQTIASLKKDSKDIKQEPEETKVDLVFSEEEPQVDLDFPDEDVPETRAEETPPREEFDERDFMERFEEEERLDAAQTKPFVANLGGSQLTGDAEKNIMQEREELFPKELVGQGRTQESYYSKLASGGGKVMDKTEIFPSDEIEAGVTASKPRSRRRRAYSTLSVPGPEPDPEYIKRIMKIVPRPDKRVMSFYDPQNHVCEEYRLLGKNLIHTFATTPGNKALGKVITLTSSARGEGKTLTCVNLSNTLSQDLNDRVLLMDADLRHPKVHRYMGVSSGSGLNDLLLSDDPESILEDCITRTDTGLHLLMSSSLGRNPSPLLDSENMDRVLALLRARYSIIIADTPPVLLATDALTLGVKGDGMLFLLRARKTQREQIQEARQRIARLEIRMLGYVINNVKSFLPQIWRKYYYGNY